MDVQCTNTGAETGEDLIKEREAGTPIKVREDVFTQFAKRQLSTREVAEAEVSGVSNSGQQSCEPSSSAIVDSCETLGNQQMISQRNETDEFNATESVREHQQVEEKQEVEDDHVKVMEHLPESNEATRKALNEMVSDTMAPGNENHDKLGTDDHHGISVAVSDEIPTSSSIAVNNSSSMDMSSDRTEEQRQEVEELHHVQAEEHPNSSDVHDSAASISPINPKDANDKKEEQLNQSGEQQNPDNQTANYQALKRKRAHKKCPHGRQKYYCRDCGGRAYCSHGKLKKRCFICGGSGLCMHRRQQHQCVECGGTSICIHKKQRNICKECRGSGICQHNKIRWECKSCNGASICEHGRQRNKCVPCKGASICKHDKQRTHCKICSAHMYCEHERRIGRCKKCKELKQRQEPELIATDVVAGGTPQQVNHMRAFAEEVMGKLAPEKADNADVTTPS